jgi:hypothetical protein
MEPDGTTTIRVARSTRDRLARVGADDFDGVSSADAVIRRLLDDHIELMTRARARSDSARLRNDPDDRAEVEQISRDFGAADAW